MSAPGSVPVSTETVEGVVRAQLSKALGGVRGMLEAAVPTAMFTATYLITHELKVAILLSVATAAVLLVVRLVHRSTLQFVLNAFFGIAIGAFFAYRAGRNGGSADDQALAYFLPGLLINAGYAVVMLFSVVVRWPLVGFIVGSVTAQAEPGGDPLAWRRDPQVVRLCTRLTLLLALPNLVRIVVQGPFYLAGRSGAMDADAAVAVLGVCKVAMGWPLQVAALGLMVWLLSRNATPMRPTEAA